MKILLYHADLEKNVRNYLRNYSHLHYGSLASNRGKGESRQTQILHTSTQLSGRISMPNYIRNVTHMFRYFHSTDQYRIVMIQ